MNIADAVAALVMRVPDPSGGLPDDVFYYISRTTPLVNVDLLIKDETGRALLSWRDDPYAGCGWHVPGGIVRFRETLEARVQKTAETELGVSDISFDPAPIALNQIIHPHREIRGHFVSLLYKCHVPGAWVPRNDGLLAGDVGYAMWHDRCPDNLLKVQEIYRTHIDGDA
ncbi:MAG: NUDIX domain-containing protein [Syntrophobacteraceae bacterium]